MLKSKINGYSWVGYYSLQATKHNYIVEKMSTCDIYLLFLAEGTWPLQPAPLWQRNGEGFVLTLFWTPGWGRSKIGFFFVSYYMILKLIITGRLRSTFYENFTNIVLSKQKRKKRHITGRSTNNQTVERGRQTDILSSPE